MSGVDVGAVVPLVAIGLPLVLAAITRVHGLRSSAEWLAPWGALPSVGLAVGWLPASTVDVNWMLFGMRLYAPDAVTHGFLVLTGLAWLFAGVFARSYLAEDPRRHRFWGFFLATMGGNLGVVLAQDVASFYLFYAVMTFSAYGLILHEGSGVARRAGRVYIVMALAGEVLLVAAFLLIAGAGINLGLQDVPRAVAASPQRDLVVGLLLAGFGIKAGAVPLHVWLPSAHAVAPTPASIVLSGAMTKAGLLGWLRFLPLGVVVLPATGALLVGAGLFAVFYGVAVGVTQNDAKTVLAYSTISQMGFMTAALGVGLAAPGVAELATVAVLYYALHHALAKGSLFLGAAVAKAAGADGWPRRLVALGLLWSALDLAGAPLSSGALAKISLTNVVALAPWVASSLGWLLSLAVVGSTLLMARFLSLTLPRREAAGGAPRPGLWLPWGLLLLVDAAILLQPPIQGESPQLLVRPDTLWSAAWPLMVGAALAGGAWYARRHLVRAVPAIPAGDVLEWLDAASGYLRDRFEVARVRITTASQDLVSQCRRVFPAEGFPDRLLGLVERVEQSFWSFRVIGALLVFLLAFLLILLIPERLADTAASSAR